jgi:hypothetical protein
MRALRELVAVIVAGVLAFFGAIALAIGFVLPWVRGMASGLCLMVAMFAGVMYGITGTFHDGQIALTYLGYAAIPFVLTLIVGYYRSKRGRVTNQLTARRNTLAS